MLAEIVARKREAVAERKAGADVAALQASLAPSDRSLHDALTREHTSFILECKKASPTKGLIRPTFDLQEIATAYSPFADAISVITDEPFFQGQLENLRILRQQVTQPVLCKDFIVDPYQVLEARSFGADAILLMLSVLTDAEYQACYQVAKQYNLDVLTEVHSNHEMDRALALDAPIIGVNNRNLHTLEIDRENVFRMARRVPNDRLLVCESGMRHHSDIVEVRDRVDGFLVGSSIMSRPDLDIAVRELIFGRTKVCGLTTGQHARKAYDAGACWGGLIFYSGSPRAVQTELAKRIMETETQLNWAGVFVDHEPDEISQICNQLSLRAIQLHGDYDPMSIGRIHAQISPSTAIWSRWVASDHSAPPPSCPQHVSKIICDPMTKTKLGGTGVRFDWEVIAPMENRDHLIVAGGLNPQNAAVADLLGVWALDVNSGVESRPGVKDGDLLNAFFAARRGRGRRRSL